MRTAAILRCLLFFGLIILSDLPAFSQTLYTTNYPPNGGQYSSYMPQSTAFRQEIARVEINVVRPGMAPLSITEVPRLAKDDILKVRMLEEPVNGVKPDQSNYNWTFLIAFINPSQYADKTKAGTEEIQFKRTGWYKEYSFTVPYDSQPIFFLYPKPNYREKILNFIEKHQEDIRKIGDKTIEIANAYAQIGSFLNELQFVINTNRYYNGYGSSSYGTSNYSSSVSSYYYGTTTPSQTKKPEYNFDGNRFTEQAIERLARSFNIRLPNCWGYTYDNYTNNNNGSGSYYNNYNNYNSYNNYGGYNSYYGYNASNNLISRAQCVAKTVSLEDFDTSLSKMLQQGGILAASQLAQKYPQIAHWINIAAVAIDLILKITKKTPLRIVPSVVSANSNQLPNYAYQQGAAVNNVTGGRNNPVKISLFAESAPDTNNFVTAYPLVVHKWQANPDPEVINLPTPVLMGSCLAAGQNIIQSTDVVNDWMADNFTRDFKLVISSTNGFRKEFLLKKNIGMSGWELNLTKEELDSFPKINMTLDSEIVGKRGFNEIRSPKFELPLPVNGGWTIDVKSQKEFAVGGKRAITLKNQFGNCRCLQAVIYKPSFGGQFVFEANNPKNPLIFSDDNKEVSFEVDATNFKPGPGQLELKQSGSDATSLNINLFPAPPLIQDFKFAKGDNQAMISGERLDQIKAIRINGQRAVFIDNSTTGSPAGKANIAVPERLLVFQDSSARHSSSTASLDLELDGDRIYKYPKVFEATLSRPRIITNDPKEIDGYAVFNKSITQFDLSQLPVFPIETREVSVNIQNALTDYNFKFENLEVETRIENSQINPAELPKASFEVLDWKNMKVIYNINEQSQKLLGGRRLQFRIKDRFRGDSDWYTIRKTFVRIPDITSVKCSKPNSNCELRGAGLDYIGEISVDGGKVWLKNDSNSLAIQTSPQGERVLMLPFYSSKELLLIKLRDFPTMGGLMFTDYLYSNSVRGNISK